jgi:hypothetical protein
VATRKIPVRSVQIEKLLLVVPSAVKQMRVLPASNPNFQLFALSLSRAPDGDFASAMMLSSPLTMMSTTTHGNANVFESPPMMIANGGATQTVEQEFLRTRRVVAAVKRLKNEARVKPQVGRYFPFLDQDAATLNRHRNQVASAVAKAKYRIASMGKEDADLKYFGTGFIATIRRWRYNRRQKKPRGISDKMGLWLWTKQLKAMECNFGSSMMLTFAFLRWVFFLNGLLSVLWIVAIIVPFFVNPPQSYDWQEFADAFRQKNFTLAMQVWHCSPWIPIQRTIFP